MSPKRTFFLFRRNSSPKIKPGSGPKSGRKRKKKRTKQSPGEKSPVRLRTRRNWFAISENVDENTAPPTFRSRLRLKQEALLICFRTCVIFSYYSTSQSHFPYLMQQLV